MTDQRTDPPHNILNFREYRLKQARRAVLDTMESEFRHLTGRGYGPEEEASARKCIEDYVDDEVCLKFAATHRTRPSDRDREMLRKRRGRLQPIRPVNASAAPDSHDVPNGQGNRGQRRAGRIRGDKCREC